nr:putative swi/snf-related matrix-associated actin-dependent regulator [Quercus suber]
MRIQERHKHRRSIRNRLGAALLRCAARELTNFIICIQHLCNRRTMELFYFQEFAATTAKDQDEAMLHRDREIRKGDRWSSVTMFRQLLDPRGKGKAKAMEKATTSKKRPSNLAPPYLPSSVGLCLLFTSTGTILPSSSHRPQVTSREVASYQTVINMSNDYYDAPHLGYARLTSIGPQQSRKPTTPASNSTQPQVQAPSFDPRALLNPRGKGAALSPPAANTNGDLNDSQLDERAGMGNMLENMYGIQNREATYQRKRKPEIGGDDEVTPEAKKVKSTFNGTSKGGIISDHLKNERKQLAAEASIDSADSPSTQPHAAIDLTNDDDDEVVFVKDTGEEEICLGVIFGKANIHSVPHVSAKIKSSIGKDHWPRTRLEHRRQLAPSMANSKAIELYDKKGIRIGQLDLPTASALVPLIDAPTMRKLRISMALEERKRGPGETEGMPVSQYCKVFITMYAPRKMSQQIGKYLSQKNLFFTAPAGNLNGREFANPQVPQVFGAAPRPGLERRTQAHSGGAVVTRTVEEIRRDALGMMENLTKHNDLPEMEADEEFIATPLLPHQKQALSFLTDHERDDQSWEQGASHSLWKQNKDGRGWYHVVTGDKVMDRPAAVQGGMLADSMGLGKTLSILALIAARQDAAKAFEQTGLDAELSKSVERCAKTTLIVCPKSVMSNWTQQINAHIKYDKLQVYSYHGSSRITDVDTLAEYDIILTTYNTVAAESNKPGAPLRAIQWFRIVLDEAHQIRNASTQVSKACCGLYAQRRWAVTGTPIQNRLDDLGALIRFLHIKPFDEISAWNAHIMARFKMADVEVIPHLHLLIDSITLCRGKEKIGLGERKEYTERLEFSESEKKIYARVAGESSKQLKIMTSKGLLKGKSYAQVLKALGRLRMICAHGLDMFSEEDRKDIAEGIDPDNAIALDLGDEPELDHYEFITEKQAYDTLHMFMENDSDICVKCQRKMNDQESDNEDEDTAEDGDDDNDHTIGYLTPCYHLICNRCRVGYEKAIQLQLGPDNHYLCPYCPSYNRKGLFEYCQSSLDDYLEAREQKVKRSRARKWDESTYSGPHTKVKKLLADLRKSSEESARLGFDEPPIRSVIFSSWTTYLDLIEVALDNADIGYLRLDGTMSIKQRTAVMEQFKTDPSITVMVISIKAGGQGLNLTSANNVYMMEPQFNPGVEQQAIDRVHRLGQTRDVVIKHYIMSGSVEEGILELQQRKNKLAEMSMDRSAKMSKAEEQQKKLDDLRLLFK